MLSHKIEAILRNAKPMDVVRLREDKATVFVFVDDAGSYMLNVIGRDPDATRASFRSIDRKEFTGPWIENDSDGRLQKYAVRFDSVEEASVAFAEIVHVFGMSSLPTIVPGPPKVIISFETVDDEGASRE